MRETVTERYRKALPGSWARWERARRVIPGGITHDGRHLTPFPLYVERASGPRKWDVDGREYVDYWMGHGALFLGHSHPALVEAMGYGNCVLVHDTPENREVAGDVAIWFDVADRGSLAAALERIRSRPDEARERGRAAAERARALFDWETIADRYAALLRRVAGAPEPVEGESAGGVG